MAPAMPSSSKMAQSKVANVAMSALGFVYAPLTPLDPTHGMLQYQPILLAVLALAGGLGFCTGPAARQSPQLPTLLCQDDGAVR